MNLWQRIKLAAFTVFDRYESATPSVHRSHVPGALLDARLDISKSTRKEIMRKARYYEKNNAIARRIASVYCDFTVGANGMVFTPASSDAKWNAAAKLYLEKTLSVIDLNTRQPFGSLQQLIAWREAFDGDCFIVKTSGQDNSGRWWPRIQIIEAHLCETPESEASREGVSVVDGVELDGNGRPSGYWFKASSDSQNFRLVDARNVIHIGDPERSQQARTLSRFAAALNYLQRLDDLQELELRAIADGAEKSTFIKSSTGQLPPGMGGVTGRFRDTAVKTGVAQTTDASAVRDAVGGRVVALGLGEEVSQFNPARPTESTRYLWSYLTSSACAAFGIPKLICFSEWLDGAQGTVVRGDYDIAAQFFRAASGVHAAAFREVILYSLSWGIKTERELADPPADWTNLSTTAPRAVNVDVGRNAAAKQSDLKLGLTSHEAEFAALGLDARTEVTKQINFIAFVKRTCAEVSAREGVEVHPAEVLGEIVTGSLPALPAPADQPQPQELNQ